jgi:hypothetical protein
VSKKWSSYEDHQEHTDSWRIFLEEGTFTEGTHWEQYLNEERFVLTEHEKQGLLQEIDFLKNVFNWMTGSGAKSQKKRQVKGGAPGGSTDPQRQEPAVSFQGALKDFASKDPKAQALAARVHFSGKPESADDNLKKINQLLDAAKKSQDPEVMDAAAELETTIKDAGDDGVVDTSNLGEPIETAPTAAAPGETRGGDADPSQLGEPIAVDAPTPLSVSATEMALMHNVGKQRGGDMFAVTVDTLENLGAALRHPEVGPIIKDFKGKFFKQLQGLRKQANVGIAEGADERDPLAGGTKGYMKGRARAGDKMSKDAPEMKKAAYVYVKPMGGKPPRIVRDLQKNLQKALLNPSMDELFYAAAAVGAKIKDPKQRKQYEARIEKELEQQPEKRIAAYNQNATEVLDNILKMATNTLAQVVPQKQSTQSRLPENLQERLIIAITEAFVERELKQRETNEKNRSKTNT